MSDGQVERSVHQCNNTFSLVGINVGLGVGMVVGMGEVYLVASPAI